MQAQVAAAAIPGLIPSAADNLFDDQSYPEPVQADQLSLQQGTQLAAAGASGPSLTLSIFHWVMSDHAPSGVHHQASFTGAYITCPALYLQASSHLRLLVPASAVAPAASTVYRCACV